MLTTNEDALAAILNGWKLDDREVAWLWYFLAIGKDERLDNCALNSSLMREQMAECLRSNQSLAREAEHERGMQLLPDEVFQWIKKDERQTDWLARRAIKKASVMMLQGPITTMTGKKSLIAIFDIWDADISSKESFLRDLKQEWNEHLQSDRIFRWFKQENEEEKCSLAWDWIEKNKSSMTRREKPFTNHSELLAFFDRSSTSADEKKHYVDTIKRRWSTQKHRERTPHKKQYNFVFSDEVNNALDRLAQDHQTSRTKTLEQLIMSEVEHKIYLSKPS